MLPPVVLGLPYMRAGSWVVLLLQLLQLLFCSGAVLLLLLGPGPCQALVAEHSCRSVADLQGTVTWYGYSDVHGSCCLFDDDDDDDGVACLSYTDSPSLLSPVHPRIAASVWISI
jgi:hypothetical protein